MLDSEASQAQTYSFDTVPSQERRGSINSASQEAGWAGIPLVVSLLLFALFLSSSFLSFFFSSFPSFFSCSLFFPPSLLIFYFILFYFLLSLFLLPFPFPDSDLDIF